MHKLIVLSLLLVATTMGRLSAQQTLTGQVVDESDGTPIPYTTIGISGTDIGTVSDGKGSFKLVIPETLDKPDATLVFSCVGYTDLDVAVASLKANDEQEYRLTPFVHEMPEVRISSKPPKEVFYGYRGRALLTHFHFYTSTEEFEELGRELGRVLKVAPDIKLEEFNFFVENASFKRVKFRLNLYDLSNEVPEKIKLGKDILFDVTQSSGWFKVDLVPYNIYLQGYKKIGVTIQWLESEKNDRRDEFFSIPVGLVPPNGLIRRSKSEAPWQFDKGNLSMYVKALKYQ